MLKTRLDTFVRVPSSFSYSSVHGLNFTSVDAHVGVKFCNSSANVFLFRWLKIRHPLSNFTSLFNKYIFVLSKNDVITSLWRNHDHVIRCHVIKWAKFEFETFWSANFEISALKKIFELKRGIVSALDAGAFPNIYTDGKMKSVPTWSHDHIF